MGYMHTAIAYLLRFKLSSVFLGKVGGKSQRPSQPLSFLESRRREAPHHTRVTPCVLFARPQDLSDHPSGRRFMFF